MKKKLNKILLVDDSESDNFYHARIIKKCNVAENIVIKLSAEEALEYLKTAYRLAPKRPNPAPLVVERVA